jgi:hypothetical protein
MVFQRRAHEFARQSQEDGIAVEASNAPGPTCSIGIMVYNEERNVANAINAILEHPPESAELTEVIVVASGCTDRTTEIVADLAERNSRVRLVIQEERVGKAAAINLFVASSRSPIVIMVNGDNIVRPGTIDALLAHFDDPEIGMVGGHPIPVNDERTFLGYAVHLQWRLHDQIARASPKMGEIVAFRNIVYCIPTDTPVDELSIQAVVTAMGFGLVYEPGAIVYNRGPATLSDFMLQRRRICAGHLRVAKQQGYTASTMSVTRILRALVRCHPVRSARSKWWVPSAIALEMIARGLGYYDYMRRRPHHIWTAVPTTKNDVAQGVRDWEQKVPGFHLVGTGVAAAAASTNGGSRRPGTASSTLGPTTPAPGAREIRINDTEVP